MRGGTSFSSPMIAGAFLVRNLHIMVTDREVVREVRAKLKPTFRNARRFRMCRHRYYRETLVAHRENWELYHAMQSGEFWPHDELLLDLA